MVSLSFPGGFAPPFPTLFAAVLLQRMKPDAPAARPLDERIDDTFVSGDNA